MPRVVGCYYAADILKETLRQFGDCCRQWGELGVKSRQDFLVAERLLRYVRSTEGIYIVLQESGT